MQGTGEIEFSRDLRCHLSGVLFCAVNGRHTGSALALASLIACSFGLRAASSIEDFATNVGTGFNYRFTDWVGAGADYRTFFVHRDESTPRVHRLTTGLTFSLK